MPEGYKNVGIQEDLYNEVEMLVKRTKRYRSVSEFIHEAIRLRLERFTKEELEQVETRRKI